MIKTENLEHSGYISEILIHSYEKLSEIEKALISKEYGRDNKILSFNMDTREFRVVNDDFFCYHRKERFGFLNISNLENINNKDELFNSFYELEAQFNIDELSMDNFSILLSINNSTSPFYLLNLHQINEFINRNNLLSGDFILDKRKGGHQESTPSINNTLSNKSRFVLPTFVPMFSYFSSINKLVDLVEIKISKSELSDYDKEEMNKLIFTLETARALLNVERSLFVFGGLGFWGDKTTKWKVSFDYVMEYFSTLSKSKSSRFYSFFASSNLGELFDYAIKSGNIVDVPDTYYLFKKRNLPLSMYIDWWVDNCLDALDN